jgi:hypothetical protein
MVFFFAEQKCLRNVDSERIRLCNFGLDENDEKLSNKSKRSNKTKQSNKTKTS